MVGEIQKTPDQCQGLYRVGLVVADRFGNKSHMHWHFDPSEIEVVEEFSDNEIDDYLDRDPIYTNV